jgi:O-antigen/teichoic acid export membrane protein
VTTHAPGPGERRRATARGAVINSVFLVALGGLNMLKAVVAAAFLTQSEFGVWSILFLAIALVIAIKSVAVGDKYIQQDEPDQTLAFQKAFTLELITAALMMGLAFLLAPLVVVIYGESELLVPTMALSLILPGLALQAPIWVYYRRMDFLRQRLLLAVDPLVSFTLTVGLAAAGVGYWSLIAGAVAGAVAGGIVAVLASPIRLALHYDHGTMKRYLSFSWPLVVAVGSGLAIAQLSIIFGERELGLAGAGAIGLAAIITQWTDRADAVITQAMYPAICRVAEQRDLLFEAFAKSNRLALMWGVPFGVGLSLFAGDLIDHVLGSGWDDTLVLLQVFGIIAAVNHIGFNWSAFFRARGETRPIAIVNVLALTAFVVAALPLLVSNGLGGFAAGMAIMTAVSLTARFYYLGRLFPNIEIARHVFRAIAPTLPAAGAVLALRLALDAERTLEVALAEIAVYVLVTVVATLVFERRLLREVVSYLRPAPQLETGIP